MSSSQIKCASYKKVTWFHKLHGHLTDWLINLLTIFESQEHMCFTPLHCSGRMNRLGLLRFDIYCPCSFSVPRDKSLQFSHPPCRPRFPTDVEACSWHGLAKSYALPCSLLCASPLAALADVYSCSAVLAGTGSGCSRVLRFLPSHTRWAIE